MKYRPEIDGLRALAVVPVILFHAGVEQFSGGYVGVDVFFVISGYLITTILIEDLENNRFSIANFYERRARRILPALFFVMLCCIPFAWMWMLPAQLKEFSQSLVAVSLFASNIFFWHESDYFAAAAEMKPLLHTWSLAVEEQYYLVFPVFLLIAWRFGKQRVMGLIIILAAFSLILSEWGWRNSPETNFFTFPARAWELLAGSLAAFRVQSRGVRPNDTWALIGLAAIVLAVLLYDDNTPYPSLYTLLPVMGTVLLVLYAGSTTLAARLLSTRMLVGIGLISYSAYLWHQPLFAFARIRSLNDPSTELMILLSVISLLLACFSWHFVEKPFRSRGVLFTSKSTLFKSSLAGLLAFISVGVSGNINDGFEDRLTEAQKKLLAYENYPRDTVYRTGTCLLVFYQDQDDFTPDCLSAGKGIFVWGDSHAAALSGGLRAVRDDVSQFTASGCPPLLNTDITSPARPQCRAINDQVFSLLAGDPAHEVILHANWILYDKNYEELLGETLSRLKEIGVERITVIGGVPQYQPTLPRLLFSEGVSLDARYNSINDNDSIRTMDGRLEKIAASHDVQFLSAIDEFCDTTTCLTVIENNESFTLTAWDSAHLTLEGAVYLTRGLFE